MVNIQSGSGVVTIGSFGNGYPRMTTHGDRMIVPDPGIPILQYAPLAKDPLTIWKTQPSVRKVVGFAARQFASVPWHLYHRVDDNDRRRITDSPASDIMAEPSPNVTGYMFWSSMITDRLLYDVCLAVLMDGELVRIPPAMIHIKSDLLGRPTAVIIQTPPNMDNFDVTDAPKILSWGWHSSKSGGVSPMHTLAVTLNENLRSIEWRTKQWESSPKAAGYLTRPAEMKWERESKDRFLESWRQWRDSLVGGTPILEDGMEYHSLSGMNPKDAQDIAGRELTDIEVCSAFYMPPELLGIRSGTFSNIDAFRQMLFGPTLGPLITEMQQAVNTGGLIEALDTTPRLYFEMNRESAMAGGFFEQARVLQTMTGAPILTVAEGRARLNLPYLEGTDTLVVPLNVTEGGQASPSDSGEQNVGGDNAAPENREDQ